MNASSQGTVLTSLEAKAELRQRILEIVNRKSGLTDVGIWQESAPNYLPWRAMIEEIKALDKDKKLRLEIVEPGHWVIHSLEAPQPAAQSAAKATRKSRASKTTRRQNRA